MRNWIKTLAILLVLAFTLFPAGTHVARILTGQTGGASSENRVLVTWPDWSSAEGNLAKYTSLVSRYFNDHFGGRAFAIRSRNKLSMMIGDGTASVLKGRTPGWYFFNDPSIWESYEGQTHYNQADINQWVASLGRLQKASKNGGAVFAAMIPPDKARIYPEHAPLLRGKPANRRFADDIVAAAKQENVTFLDIDPALRRAKQDGPVYFKTDTHWTRRGAYEAYVAAMVQFNKNGDHFPVLQRANMLLNDDRAFSGDLANMLGLKGTVTEAIEDYAAPFPSKPFTKETLDDASITRSNWHTETYDNGTPNGRVLIIIGDSFSQQMISFFEHSFDRIILMHHRRGAFGLAEVLAFEPDAVLFAPVEREAVRLREFAKP